MIAEKLCSVALIFIMFYGSFNTKWSTAKKYAGKAVVLSTLGVFVTAIITTVLCYVGLKMSLANSFLIGAVLSSTDAASVFAILRKNKLNLKDGSAPILEVESGSNDPVAYLLTLIAINMVKTGEMESVILPIVLLLVIGTIIAFFDGLTSLSQFLIFFLIGWLSFPHQMPRIMGTAVYVVLVLTLVARPIAVFLFMKLMKCSTNQCMLVSWAGLRGASSCVFAIMAVAAGVPMKQDLFHIVFMVSLFSVVIQGTLLPWAAKKFDMIDDTADVRKTFND